jgi:hypothetical protein
MVPVFLLEFAEPLVLRDAVTRLAIEILVS